jgi:hypothetical protein
MTAAGAIVLDDSEGGRAAEGLTGAISITGT